jgi:acyl-coenzyme A thioesterase PaaI-like protein
MVAIAQTAADMALAGHPHRLREFGYHFVRTVPPDGRPIKACAQFRHLGRRMAVIDVEVTDAAVSTVGLGRATATA